MLQLRFEMFNVLNYTQFSAYLKRTLDDETAPAASPLECRAER